MFKRNLWTSFQRLHSTNNSFRTNRKAKLSTTPPNAKTISTEEKAAEVNKAAWPTLRKYAILIVPSILSIILTTIVVNNTHVRYFLENYIPSYIDFVRNHYGFSDEDYNELKRIKSVLTEEAKDVNVKVVFMNGQTIHMVVSGLKSVDEMMTDIEFQNPNTIIKSISFDDSHIINDDDDGGNMKSIESVSSSDLAINTITTMFNSIRNILSQFFPTWVSSTSSLSKEEKEANKYKMNINQHIIPPTLQWQRSHWDTEPFFNLPPTVDNILPIRYQNNNKSNTASDYSLYTPTTDTIRWSIINLLLYPPPPPSSSSSSSSDQIIGMERYNNILYYQLKSIRKYLQGVRRDKIIIPTPLLSETVDAKYPQYNKLKKQQQQQQLEAANNANTKSAIDQAKLEIAGLEQRVIELQQERVNGKREIDLIDAEIRDVKAKIVQLQRQHLNYFYYF